VAIKPEKTKNAEGGRERKAGRTKRRKKKVEPRLNRERDRERKKPKEKKGGEASNQKQKKSRENRGANRGNPKKQKRLAGGETG